MNNINHQIVGILKNYCPETSSEQLLCMIKNGIIDTRTCKAIIVKNQVEKEVKSGKNKIDAIYHAAEDLACSVAFVKRIVYNYK